MKKRLLIPTRTQWNQWSLPSKLTFVGTAVGVASLVLSMLFFWWPFPDWEDRSAAALTTADAHLAIEAMVNPSLGDGDLQIQSITSPVEGISAVTITPPYREFPNIVLFVHDSGLRRWKRVREGLSLGIQADRSKVLDLHTVGLAVDVMQPTEEDARKYLPSLALAFGWVAVPYDKFIHFHPSGRESYYVDKRGYSQFATELSEHPRPDKDTECTLFDTPDLTTVSLSHSSGRFELRALTANDQTWIVTFEGIDSRGLLAAKVVRVEKAHAPHGTGQAESIPVEFDLEARIANAAQEYGSVAPIARIAFHEIAYPATPEEYRAMAGHGLVLITAMSHVADELPPQPYLLVDRRRSPLSLITQEWSTPADDTVVRAFGRFRTDGLYLLPIGPSSRGRDLLLDFGTTREGFRLTPIPKLLPAQLESARADSGGTKREPERDVVLKLIEREFPTLIKPR